MLKTLCALLALVLSLTGCASYPDVHRQKLEQLPLHYVNFDAVIGWDVKDIGGRTVIEGEFRNLRYMYMDSVEVWVAARDASDKTTARSADFLLPRMVQRGQTVPFTLKLPVPPVPGTKLRFTYKYSGIEGASEGGGDVGNWMHSFDMVIPAR